MTEYYLDASALVKRYADEAGSTWVRQITDREAQHTILLAEITLAEVSAALAAKHRAPGGITQEQRDRVAYPVPADNYYRPLARRRSGITQAVIRTHNGFSRLRLTYEAGICTQVSPPVRRFSPDAVAYTICGWDPGGTRHSRPACPLHP